MQVSLADKERHSMLFLGGNLNFTFDSPGPVEVNLETLTPQQKQQLYFNWKRGVLSVSDETAMQTLAPVLAPKTYTPPVQQQVVPVTPPQPRDIMDSIKDKEVKLRGILRKKVDAIKADLPTLSGSELADLVLLEKETKNRKKLLDLIGEYVDKKVLAVTKRVGTEDVGNQIYDPGSNNLDKSMLVVESETEDVTLIPSDKELAG